MTAGVNNRRPPPNHTTRHQPEPIGQVAVTETRSMAATGMAHAPNRLFVCAKSRRQIERRESGALIDFRHSP
jgi:hypothetical protein